jgi:hypothetical protein
MLKANMLANNSNDPAMENGTSYEPNTSYSTPPIKTLNAPPT